MMELTVLHFQNTSIYLNVREIRSGMDDLLWSDLDLKKRQKYKSLVGIERQLEWCESERALIELKNQYPDRKFEIYSKSHSWWNGQGVSIVATTDSKLALGIGIDIENKDRTLSDSLKYFAFTNDELLLPLSVIQLWAIKESCFKTNISNFKNEDFKSYNISHFDPLTKTGVAGCSNRDEQYGFSVLEYKNWFISVALTS